MFLETTRESLSLFIFLSLTAFSNVRTISRKDSRDSTRLDSTRLGSARLDQNRLDSTLLELEQREKERARKQHRLSLQSELSFDMVAVYSTRLDFSASKTSQLQLQPKTLCSLLLQPQPCLVFLFCLYNFSSISLSHANGYSYTELNLTQLTWAELS